MPKLYDTVWREDQQEAYKRYEKIDQKQVFKDAKLGLSQRLNDRHDFNRALVSTGISLNELKDTIPVKHNVQYYYDYLGRPGRRKE